MAKIKLGPMVGQASGSIGAVTFSHNRSGTYTRRRAIPVTSVTTYALAAKAAFSAASTYWQTLSLAKRNAWAAWASNNPITDRLGDQQLLSANAAYISLNARMLAAGLAMYDDPPIIPAPQPLISLVQVCDIGTGTFDLTYTATPLGTDDMLYTRACITDSPAIVYVNNLLRLIGVTNGAQASPFGHLTLLEARFGTALEGQTVHVFVSVFNSITGLLSAPLRADTLVTDTI